LVGRGGSGGGMTVTARAFSVSPPAPRQVNTYFALCVSAGVFHDPDVANEPLQSPDAVQVLALVELHLMFALEPL